MSNAVTAHVATENAKRYLGQFVKHFAHRVPATLADDLSHGAVAFPGGHCVLSADAARLSIALQAETEDDLLRVQDVLIRHLLRFAFRETLSIAWEDGARA